MKNIVLFTLLLAGIAGYLFADQYAIHDHNDPWGSETEVTEDHAGHDHGSKAHKKHQEDDGHDHEDHSGHDHSPREAGMISINPELLKGSEITIASPEKRKLFKQITIPARVIPDPFHRSFISAPYAARVYLKGEKRNLYPGDRVKKGEKIIMVVQSGVEENPLDLNLAGREINIEIKYARKDLNRLKKLAQKNLINTRELAEGEQRLKLALAKRDNFYQKQGRLRGKQQIRYLKAPADGIIDQFYVKNGDRVDAGAPLLALYDQKQLQVQGQIFQGDLQHPRLIHSISIGEKGRKTIAIPVDHIINQQFDFRSGKLFAPLNIKLTNSDLPPGTPVTLHLGTGEGRSKIVVPGDAVIRINTIPYLLLKKSNTTYQLKEVKTGYHHGDLIEIHSGVTPRDKIVVAGGFAIYNQTAGNVDPHAGHNH